MYLLSPEACLVSVKFGRKLSFDDVRSYAESLLVDPRFDPGFCEIVDLTEVEELDISPTDLMKLADIEDPFRQGAKRAFVARTDPQVQAAHMHQLLRNDEVNIRIFSSYREARRWIDGETAQRRSARAAGTV
jgi:hypothetical protein